MTERIPFYDLSPPFRNYVAQFLGGDISIFINRTEIIVGNRAFRYRKGGDINAHPIPASVMRQAEEYAISRIAEYEVLIAEKFLEKYCNGKYNDVQLLMVFDIIEEVRADIYGCREMVTTSQLAKKYEEMIMARLQNRLR